MIPPVNTLTLSGIDPATVSLPPYDPPQQLSDHLLDTQSQTQSDSHNRQEAKGALDDESKSESVEQTLIST